jgi:nucleoside-diphosphate-sugar epimerase
MRIVITGGAGFLGAALARRIVDAGALAVDGGAPVPVTELLLLDIAAPPADLLAAPAVTALAGDLPDLLPSVGDVDVVFHLAGVVSGAAEDDFELGMRVNLDALRSVLDWARAMAAPPVLVFTSSLAVFGADPAIGPIGIVDDSTLPRPQSSYGIQKFIGEQLVADAARRGFVRGRSVRLMTVSVRPGAPNAAASSFLSGMIREPVAGRRAVCPVDPDTPVALSSPSRTLDGILRAAEVDAHTWGSTTAMTLPALSTTPREMAAALDRVAGAGTSDLIDWEPDARVEAIVGSWPSEFVTDRATRLGLTAESSFDAIVADYLSAYGTPHLESTEAR